MAEKFDHHNKAEHQIGKHHKEGQEGHPDLAEARLGAGSDKGHHKPGSPEHHEQQIKEHQTALNECSARIDSLCKRLDSNGIDSKGAIEDWTKAMGKNAAPGLAQALKNS